MTDRAEAGRTERREGGTRPLLVVDEDRCVMAGECVYNHPDYFAWNADETAAMVTKPEIVDATDEEHAAQAISLCPGGAISITYPPIS